MQYNNITLDCIIVGDSNVGKTSIFNSVCKNVTYNSHYDITLGIDFIKYNLKYKDTTYKFNIWDSSGYKKFTNLAKTYYRKSKIAFIVYDISNIDSFLNINYWYEQLINENEKLIIILIGNKADKKRNVTLNYIKNWIVSKPLNYIETSVKNNNSFILLENNIIKKPLDYIFIMVIENFIKKYQPIFDNKKVDDKKNIRSCQLFQICNICIIC